MEERRGRGIFCTHTHSLCLTFDIHRERLFSVEVEEEEEEEEEEEQEEEEQEEEEEGALTVINGRLA